MHRAAVLVVLLSTLSTSVMSADVAKAGRSAVMNSLKDPESARFKDVFVNGAAYCGSVNAKNSYGGYAGFKRFIAVGTTVMFAPESETGAWYEKESFERMWREFCWHKDKLKAFKKLQDDLAAEADRDIERQREELRKLADEREREKAQ